MSGHIPIGYILLRLMEDCCHWLFSHIQLVLCAQDAIHLHQPFAKRLSCLHWFSIYWEEVHAFFFVDHRAYQYTD